MSEKENLSKYKPVLNEDFFHSLRRKSCLNEPVKNNCSWNLIPGLLDGMTDEVYLKVEKCT